MILAVASGKGGTGKTTVAASLAASLAATCPTTLVDLDVEAPNAHLFFSAEWQGEETAWLPVPEVDEDACTRCGVCAQVCQFSAIAVLGPAIVTFNPMCHGCTACWTLCPENAITPGRRELGVISWGSAKDARGLDLAMGRLRVGEAMSPPLMKQVMARIPQGGNIIIDAPPGTSCPVMTAAGFADALLLVTEPTPFGLYDLKLAVEALKPFGKPMAVVVNRDGLGDQRVYDFCREAGLWVAARIPFDRQVAEGYAQGRRLEQTRPQWGPHLAGVYAELKAQAGEGAS